MPLHVLSTATVAWAGKQENEAARAKAKIINESNTPKDDVCMSGKKWMDENNAMVEVQGRRLLI